MLLSHMFYYLGGHVLLYSSGAKLDIKQQVETETEEVLYFMLNITRLRGSSNWDYGMQNAHIYIMMIT